LPELAWEPEWVLESALELEWASVLTLESVSQLVLA
jgi:hypothetical protein